MRTPKPFIFSSKAKRTPAGANLAGSGRAIAQDPAALEVVTPIQGQMPQSKQEYRVGIALQRLGLGFIYQYSIGGGRSLRGGQVVDYWIYTAPKPTPCFIQGAYWHKAQTDMADEYKQLKVQHVYSGYVMPNLLLQEKDLSSVDAAYQTLRKALIG